MEKKIFLETFPTLQVKRDLQDAFADVWIEHIFTTKKRDILRIYISANRIVEKKDVFAMEQQIKKQLFANANIMIKIYEHFQLSQQYTPKNLFQEYRDSLLLELKELSPIMFSMLKKAEARFQDEHVIFQMEEK